MALFLPPTGISQQVTPQHGPAFTLGELQSLVEGPLECVFLPDGRLLFLNEEGKCLGLALNAFATALARSVLLPGDVIVGPSVVLTLQEAGEE